MSSNLNALANGMAEALNGFATHSAQAAAKANGVSAASQSAQGAFNQNSANMANNIAADRISEQYAFNAGQAAAANAFTGQMWDKTASWNEEMFNRQMEFNAAEAQKNREWQEHMSSTAYQRAVKDLHAAGLNPILAATSGLSAPSVGGGQASIGGTSMTSASGQMATGGLLQGVSASEGNYQGQMEYMGGMLGLLSAAIGGLANAETAMGGMGKFGESLAEALGTILDPTRTSPTKDFLGGLEFDENGPAKKAYDFYRHNFKHNSSSGTFQRNYKHVLK